MNLRILAFTLTLHAAAPVLADAQEPHSATSDSSALAERIESILRSAQSGPEARAEPIAQELQRLGSRAIRPMFEALAERLPVGVEVEVESGGDARAVQRRALEQALGHMPLPILHGILERAVETDLRAELRIAMVRVLSQCGSALDLPLLVALAGPLSDESEACARIGAQLEHAITIVLLRDARAFGMVESTMRGRTLAVQTTLLRAVAATATDDGIKCLARLLERVPTLRLFVLNLMGRMAPHVSRPIDETVLAEVRILLLERGSDVLPEALLLCGQLEDFESAPLLVSLVRDRRRNVSSNAIWALERMSRLHFHDDSERWRTWLDTEMSWWRYEAPRAFKRLASQDPVASRSALLEIAKQHVFRHQLADAVVAAAEHAEPDFVTLACNALGQLDSKVALPFLIERIEHRDVGVRTSALASLRAITRLKLPPNPDEWRRATAPRARP